MPAHHEVTPLTDRDASTAPSASRTPRSRRRRRLRLLLGIPLTIALVLVGGAAVAVRHLQSSLDAKIDRFPDPAAAIPAAERPAPQPVTGPTAAVNLLVFGSDSRISAGDPTQWAAGAQRTDAIMLVHLPADRSGAYVVSIPRDSWVDIPGHGHAKINAAFSWGGPALAVRTVEQLTGVRIDHLVLTDFTGFARITDLLGGVEVTVPKATGMGNSHARITAGTHTMDGATALAYVRERYTLPGGDFDRVKRQQNWIRAVLRKASGVGLAEDPQRLYAVLDAVAGSVATDRGFSIEAMRDLLLSLHGAGPGATHFLTVPVTGTGWSPDHQQSIVLLDTPAAAGLWTAIRTDHVDAWLAAAKYPTLGAVVR